MACVRRLVITDGLDGRLRLPNSQSLLDPTGSLHALHARRLTAQLLKSAAHQPTAQRCATDVRNNSKSAAHSPGVVIALLSP